MRRSRIDGLCTVPNALPGTLAVLAIATFLLAAAPALAKGEREEGGKAFAGRGEPVLSSDLGRTRPDLVADRGKAHAALAARSAPASSQQRATSASRGRGTRVEGEDPREDTGERGPGLILIGGEIDPRRDDAGRGGEGRLDPGQDDDGGTPFDSQGTDAAETSARLQCHLLGNCGDTDPLGNGDESGPGELERCSTGTGCATTGDGEEGGSERASQETCDTEDPESECYEPERESQDKTASSEEEREDQYGDSSTQGEDREQQDPDLASTDAEDAHGESQDFTEKGGSRDGESQKGAEQPRKSKDWDWEVDAEFGNGSVQSAESVPEGFYGPWYQVSPSGGGGPLGPPGETRQVVPTPQGGNEGESGSVQPPTAASPPDESHGESQTSADAGPGARSQMGESQHAPDATKPGGEIHPGESAQTPPEGCDRPDWLAGRCS